MNHILSAVVLAFSSNIDNLGVGIAYGIASRRIYLGYNFLIAIVSGMGTLISMEAGEWANNYLSEEIANVLGAGIMILIGLYSIVQAIRREKYRSGGDNIKTAPEDPQFGIRGREAVALAISLTFNNLGGGLGAGMSHISIPLTTILTMGLSVAAIIGGFQLGERTSLKISKLGLGISSGLLITAVGVYELFV